MALFARKLQINLFSHLSVNVNLKAIVGPIRTQMEHEKDAAQSPERLPSATSRVAVLMLSSHNQSGSYRLKRLKLFELTFDSMK